MKRTNQKGVTLISLIVTIIVLIIIAGISIATLTGDNGVLKQTSTSKAEQLKATAREQVELACSAVKLAIEEAGIKDSNYSALQNSDKIQSVLLNALNTDKTGLNGVFEEGTNAENSIEIVYDGEDYKNATNNPNAKITYTIALGKNSIEIADVKTGTEVGGNGSNEEKNEYGFYYNKPYTMTTVDSNGNEKKEYYVFKENGEVEYYINGNKDGISVQGFLESAMPENTATYGENTITYNGQTLTVSEDGSTITMGANSLVCTDEEYRDIYFGKLYISKIDGFSDSIIYEDGSVIDSNGGVGPAGTLTKVGTHQWTFNGTQFRISMDGKRVYAINGFLVFEIAEILETPTISISEKTLTITEVPNATSYNVYANNVFKANITDLTLDLKTLNLAQGTYTITAKAKADGYSDSERSTSLSYIVEQTDISNYLVDRVEIGDWVDLGEGLAYTNQETYYSEYTNTDYSSTNGPTGWRVLSKTGSGETGTVTLVSAGTPLSYYYICGESETSILSLSNLSETITLTTSGTGFSANGFTEAILTDNVVDLKSLWESKKDVNGKNIINASSAHALTTNEVIKAYKEITGSTVFSTMEKTYYGGQYFNTNQMIGLMPKGEIINTNAYDLLGNGMWYWLGGSSYDENFLWFLSGHGMVSYSNDYETYGIRTCISLNSGITVNTSDTSKDGSTPEKAYILN